jgi:hypothetical protein
MKRLVKAYTDFLLNESESSMDLQEFSNARLAGAAKIAEAAKEKGGPAMLTFHHFNPKLPYYKKAAEGKFDEKKFQKELESYLKKLNSGLSGDISMKQVEFQKVMGIIEVLGELIIKSKS